MTTVLRKDCNGAKAKGGCGDISDEAPSIIQSRDNVDLTKGPAVEVLRSIQLLDFKILPLNPPTLLKECKLEQPLRKTVWKFL